MTSTAKIGFVLLIASSAACTNAQVYNSTSELRAQQCSKLPEREQAECASNARTSYGQYKKARDEAVQGETK